MCLNVGELKAAEGQKLQGSLRRGKNIINLRRA